MVVLSRIGIFLEAMRPTNDDDVLKIQVDSLLRSYSIVTFFLVQAMPWGCS